MSKARQLADLGNVYDDGALSNRSKIVNGAMQVAQRGTSAAITSGGYAALDRYRYELGGGATGRATISQSSDAPDGFGSSYKVEVTTADAAPSAAYEYSFQQRLEGQNLQSLKKGTANAESVTLSFWVKSSVTGTFIVELMDNDNSNRHINKSYTINSANTWEYKTITFAGDTTGALANDNGNSLHLQFWHGAGSQFTSGSLQTSWGALTQANRAVGQTNLYATLGNTFYLTGVQLEVGDTATPFEHRSYGQELALCQRYYQRYTTSGYVYGRFALGENRTTTKMQAFFDLGQAMRAVPTLQTTGTASDYAVYHSEAIIAATAVVYDTNPTARVTSIQVSVASGLLDGGASQFMANNNASSFIAFDSEL